MARRKESGLDLIAALPWPFGVVLGIVAYVAIRHGLGMYFSSVPGVLTQTLGQQMSGGSLVLLAWMALSLCWIGAAVSFFGRQRRKRLLDTQTGLDSLTGMDWREFEMVVGEAFRRRGYSVEETGLGGADGGIDLLLRRNGRMELVQCKQWRTRQVTASKVREMWGLADHHRADGVKIVCIGHYTRDARRFAEGKSIDLITGEQLLELVREGQTASRMASASRRDPPISTPRTQSPACPSCNATMTLRTNRNSGQSFWGCPGFPRCGGTRPA